MAEIRYALYDSPSQGGLKAAGKLPLNLCGLNDLQYIDARALCVCVCVYTIFPDFQIFIKKSGSLRTPRTNYMTDTAHQRNSTLATKLQKISGQTPPRPDKFHKLTHSRPPEHTSTQSRADKNRIKRINPTLIHQIASIPDSAHGRRWKSCPAASTPSSHGCAHNGSVFRDSLPLRKRGKR